MPMSDIVRDISQKIECAGMDFMDSKYAENVQNAMRETYDKDISKLEAKIIYLNILDEWRYA